MPTIKPTGMNQGDLVDFLYNVLYSIEGLCTKLDNDGGVPLTTYLANCYTAIFTITVQNQKGSRMAPGGDYSIGPTGVGDEPLIELLYQIYNSFETLTEQLDTDTLTLSTYEANCYTATIIDIMIINRRNETLGNSGTYWASPMGGISQEKLVETLYNIANSWETLCEQLDGDGTVTDTNYEALWYTATYTTKVENAKGNVLGN